MTTVDTLRIRIQTAGAVIPPLRQLVPAPRLQHLYAGEFDSSQASLCITVAEGVLTHRSPRRNRILSTGCEFSRIAH